MPKSEREREQFKVEHSILVALTTALSGRFAVAEAALLGDEAGLGVAWR